MTRGCGRKQKPLPRESRRVADEACSKRPSRWSLSICTDRQAQKPDSTPRRDCPPRRSTWHRMLSLSTCIPATTEATTEATTKATTRTTRTFRTMYNEHSYSAVTSAPSTLADSCPSPPTNPSKSASAVDSAGPTTSSPTRSPSVSVCSTSRCAAASGT